MAKGFVTILLAVVVSVGLAFVGGCESSAQTGAGVGAATGAGIGALVGHQSGKTTEGALIGGAVGGAVGYGIGSEKDKKKAAAERDDIRQELNTVTINITNSNGSISQVKLIRQGAVYIGPKGETYTSLPTEEQLKQAGYGF
ncbi:MAG: glycine zipper domain-containing protein [Planctomycetota bacterium]|jgi:hypothetical protein